MYSLVLIGKNFSLIYIILILLVDGGFSDWEEWGPCTAPCGGGDQTRPRRCDNPSPQFGGLDCIGELSDCQRCNTELCPSTCPA